MTRAQFAVTALAVTTAVTAGTAGCTLGPRTQIANCGAVAQVIPDPAAKVSSSSLGLSPDGTQIAAGCDGGVCIWNTATGRITKTLAGASGPVEWSPNGTLLATGSTCSSIKLIDATTGSVKFTLPGHQPLDVTDGPSGLTDLAFTPDGQTLASSAYDGQVRLWNTTDGSTKGSLAINSGSATANITALAIRPGGTQIAVANSSTPVQIWDLNTKTLLTTVINSPPSAGVSYSASGLLLVTTSTNSSALVTVFDATTSARRYTTPSAIDWGKVVFSPDDTRLAYSLPSNNQVMIWTLESASAMPLTGHTNQPYAVAFSPNGNTLYSVSSHDGVLVWNTNTGKLLRRFDLP